MITTHRVHKLIEQLSTIRSTMLEREADHSDVLEDLHPNYVESARNLIHYLTLRSFDIRKLQRTLSNHGFSSFSHSEGYTLTNMTNVLEILNVLIGTERIEDAEHHERDSSLNYRSSKKLLKKRTRLLFGELEHKRAAHVMVTMPTEAATNYELIKNLLLEGMNLARINLSHDNTEIWEQMIANLRKGMEETGKSCKIYIDLAGPKIRTGDLAIDENSGKPKSKHFIPLKVGDILEIQKENTEGKPAVMNENGDILRHAHISMSLPSVFEDVEPGQRIFFDDGKIAGKIAEVDPHVIKVEIVQTGLKGGKLKAEKGINLPDTALNLPSLTENDRSAFPFMAKHADIIGYSFVRNPEDVRMLQNALAELGEEDTAIVLKIETQSAFDQLPDILLTAMRSPNIGVMIARGDLAVEIGFERISEVQEQILWLCEAAHVPVIWATQVLESLAKKGRASRAEVTDVAVAVRADCIMLNKGPYIVEAVKLIHDITERMREHHVKKKGTLRPLNVARRFFNQTVPEEV